MLWALVWNGKTKGARAQEFEIAEKQEREFEFVVDVYERSLPQLATGYRVPLGGEGRSFLLGRTRLNTRRVERRGKREYSHHFEHKHIEGQSLFKRRWLHHSTERQHLCCSLSFP